MSIIWIIPCWYDSSFASLRNIETIALGATFAYIINLNCNTWIVKHTFLIRTYKFSAILNPKNGEPNQFIKDF